jgi:2-polyprenyl-3-methyl-5-hydroxy-6-metoxy-1,4-benzoquinol methylase
MNADDPIDMIARGFQSLASRAVEGGRSAVTQINLAPPFSSISRRNWLDALDFWMKHGARLLNELPARNCPACGSDNARSLFTSYDGYPFSDCLDCGCWYVPKDVTGALYSRFFADSPEAKILAKKMTVERQEPSRAKYDQGHFGELIDEIILFASWAGLQRQKMLDVGCGVGHSLIAGAKRNLSSIGLEADQDCVDLGRENNLDIRHVSQGVPKGPFDLIGIWETLEHVSDPLNLLQSIKPSLGKNGLLSILIPNLNAPSVRILREGCSVVHGGMNGPGHINFFHPSGISQLLQRAGYSVLDMDSLFSDNPFEIAAYVLGISRGAHDMVFSRKESFELPEDVFSILSGIWPVLIEIARSSISAPMLKIIACRTEDFSTFEKSVTLLQAKNKNSAALRLSKLIDQSIPSGTVLNTAKLQWKPLPPIKKWHLAKEVSIISSDDVGAEVCGNNSRFDYQIVSPSIAVMPNKNVIIFLPILEIQGSVSIGVLDEHNGWILPATSRPRTITFPAGQNKKIKLVIANLQSESPSMQRTRFRVQRGNFAVAFDK